MIEKIKAGLRYAADFYRTAPIGETIFLINAIPLTLSFYNKDIPIVCLNAVGALSGIVFAAKKFRLKQRLEKSVAEDGYDNRNFKTTIPEWCDRQTARVVAKNNGHLDDYIALCESNIEMMYWPNLKNF
jgi:hypothetical protein